MAAKKSTTTTQRLKLEFDAKGTEALDKLRKRLGQPSVKVLLELLCARAEWMQDAIDAGGKIAVDHTDDRHVFNKRNPLFPKK
jgi:hypothetical protein